MAVATEPSRWVTGVTFFSLSVIATTLVLSAATTAYLCVAGVDLTQSVYLTLNVVAGAAPIAVDSTLATQHQSADASLLRFLPWFTMPLRILGWIAAPAAFATIVAHHLRLRESARDQEFEATLDAIRRVRPGTSQAEANADILVAEAIRRIVGKN